MVVGPNFVVKSYPRFCTRGYAFTTQKRRRSSTTYDAGVCSASGDDVYYGHIHEILEIKYLGMVGLRCTVFYCDWHDNTPDRGVRTDAFGVISVNSRRKLQYYDPFILASQADQVCYIKYPRNSTNSTDNVRRTLGFITTSPSSSPFLSSSSATPLFLSGDFPTKSGDISGDLLFSYTNHFRIDASSKHTRKIKKFKAPKTTSNQYK
ncbi:hypothetical protein Bca52824_046106 [Brassica carinata]|uniref:DUF4216 domain-containing protein n=1 Tax=Brassica carinata TaxID=52824 RepID=A0A8X7UPV9_BRACI|nr:hypothetical protein Bca52824_046106 [Brassica carinata]